MIGRWLESDWNMIGIWLEYDWNMIGIWLEYDWNMIGIWLEYIIGKSFTCCLEYVYIYTGGAWGSPMPSCVFHGEHVKIALSPR